MSSVQTQFDSSGIEDIVLAPGEYEGPLVISRSCVFDGAHSTLWSSKGPVLLIEAPNVTIKNLRVEVTGNNGDEELSTAIKTVCTDTVFENVSVNGYVDGVSLNEASWKLPNIILLGSFAANSENVFSLEIEAPDYANISSNILDISLQPSTLSPGINKVKIITANIRDNTILYGELIVKSTFIRRIYISGRSDKHAKIHIDENSMSDYAPLSMPIQIEAPLEVIAPITSDNKVRYLTKGQRIPLEGADTSLIKIVYEHEDTSTFVSVDDYTFLLNHTGRVKQDDDLIFFGKQISDCGAVRSIDKGAMPITTIEVAKLQDDIEKIVVCYSVYDNETGYDFSSIEKPLIRIFCEENELYRFQLEGLTIEKTVVALEVYKYKNEWKINFVGSGYSQGLRRLCESFGVDVE